ncbi:unnamed protein product [Somion occarium]|uniref:RRM domain-containing protein n=1 Tax=Somion occarium TaxID=3059160 RepID=A0ABP1CWP5_9APHY
MAASVAPRRAPTFPPTAPADEEFINRSLLDSLDAQADAEPLSSSDSEANPPPATSFAMSSVVGASILPNYLRSPPLSADSLSPNTQNTTPSHPVYNSMNNLPILSSDFSIPSGEHDSLNQQHKANGFSGPLRGSSASFASFSNSRSRNPASFSRDNATVSFAPQFSQSQSDIFVTNTLPPSISSQQPSSFESMHNQGRPFDFAMAGAQANQGLLPNGQSKAGAFGGLDSYRMGLESGAALLGKQQNPLAMNLALMRDGSMTLQSQLQAGSQPFQSPHGLSHGHHGPLPGQTPFGPSLSGAGQGTPLSGAPGVTHLNGSARDSQQQQQTEEISTIFVVGFPDDMTEREFQNMFTFCPGFEAATLKIPNKEAAAYGSTGTNTSARPGSIPFQYGGSNDPYNIVTVNQGGVVVDNGRDGLTTSWPAPMPPTDDGHFVPTLQPPRKQIIGFAKFRTRQEALDARDALQGRRVDLEKGSVLKAEMAKKNLHTKRGPGVGSSASLGNMANVNSESLANVAALSNLMSMAAAANQPTEAFNQRDRELGVLGAIGVGLPTRRDRLVEEEERRRSDVGMVGSMAFGPRGARERAEEDEREREKKRKEAVRLRQNSYAFEAFHSVPQQMVREGANSLLSAENGIPDPNGTGYGMGFPQDNVSSSIAPWGSLRDVSASAALRKISAPNLPTSTSLNRPSSVSPEQSPPTRETVPSSPSGPTSASSQNDSTLPTSVSAPFSPQSTSSSLPRARASSPSCEQLPSTSLPASSAGSVIGSQNGHDEDLARAVNALTVSTSQGNTSPQLPSPASGASSATGRNPGDQNPPINTLYVGNLPTSPASGGSPPTILEERLRDLFSKRPGYRKLCFRQKSNGPMCFVEFEDVAYATQALKELYGHTLDGLVKGGGIRLSYSKNPLGVRTPTSGGTGQSLQQQQQIGQPQALNGPQSTPFFGDAFQRQGDIDSIRHIRRDTSGGMTSPTSSYHYTMSSPPPRFFNAPTANSGAFNAPLPSSTAALPRANSQGYGLPPSAGFSPGSNSASSTFSPFGISPSHSTIPDQPSAENINDPQHHLPHHLSNLNSHVFSSVSANIEASRAG